MPSCCWNFAFVLTVLFGPTSSLFAADFMTGRIAVWHHHKPIPKTVVLPAFSGGRYLANGLVQVGPLPDHLQPDEDGCFCFDIGDDRLALVHTFYYAHQFLTNYNTLLKELRLPQVRDVVISLKKDAKAPTSGISWRKKRPHSELRFAAPAIDPFMIAHEMSHLIDYTIGGRYKQKNMIIGGGAALRQQAEEDGVAEATANILAALELGTTGSMPFTSDTLDAAPVNDVDTFVRFPDLMTSRRQVFRSFIAAPRFAARYAEYIAALQEALGDLDQRDLLAQPDEQAASPVITQPLWHAAVRFGFKPVKILYLKTLSGWSSPEVSYATLGRELVTAAQFGTPKLATYLSDEYRRRGLPVPQMQLDAAPN